MSHHLSLRSLVIVAILSVLYQVAHGETTRGASAPATGEPEPYRQWLDAVRAQRNLREELRRSNREALEARRRLIDPWGAAQQEAREQEMQRRREAMRERIERDRELFRSLGPWETLFDPWPSQLPPEPPVPEGPGAWDYPPEPYPPLPGWDNRWYFRGY